jgi:adenylate cyclase
MDVVTRHQVGLCLSDEMLHAAGGDGPLFRAGVVIGPVETNVRSRSVALMVWLCQSNRLS